MAPRLITPRLLFLRTFCQAHLPPRPAALGRASSTFVPSPAPPKLPADQQAEFERLQRAAAVSSAFQQPDAPDAPDAVDQPTRASAAADSVDGALFPGPPPEFDGQVNPKTGEVGGPKNEPLRWGSGGDWSYKGRVTDF